MLNFEPSNSGTDIGKALEYFNNVIKKRSICFVLSDFLAQGYENPLRIASRRHDLVGIHIVDPREEALPAVGLIRAVDSETGQANWIDTSMASVRDKYSKWYQDHFNYFKTTFLKSGADTIGVRTDKPYVNALLKFFKKRSK